MPDEEISRGPRPAPAGRRYRRSVVGFLDMLGAEARRDDLRFLNDLAAAVAEERRDLELWPSRGHLELRTCWFSDNIGVSMPVDWSDDEKVNGLSPTGWAIANVAWYVGDLQAHLLANLGLLSRGAIVVGANYHDDNMIFGRALVDAYHAESAAVEARTTLSLAAAADCPTPLIPLLRDGEVTYLDHLRIGAPAPGPAVDRYMERLRNAIREGLAAAAGDALAEPKWRWCVSYFNSFVDQAGSPDGLRIDE